MMFSSSLPPEEKKQYTSSPPAGPVLPSEHFPTGWLPRVLRSRDLTILCLFAVLLITNIQTVGGGGPVGIIYWILGFLLFLFPSALICAQLYRLFPGEGAVYLWANKAFGNFWDTFIGFFCNWWPGAIGLTVEAGAVVTSIQALNGSWLLSPWQQGIVEIVVLCVAQGLCFFSQRSLQRILSVSFYAYLCMFLLVGFAGLIWLATGHPLQTDFSAPAWQLNISNYPLFATVTVALLGIAIPMNLGAEVINERRGYSYVVWGCVAIVVGYLFATFGVLAILSPKDLQNPAFIGLVFQHAFGPVFGSILSVLAYCILVVYFVCATAAYNSMFSRLLLVASVDRRLPAAMRRLNAYKVPFNATVVQTVMNVAFIVVLFFIAPGSSANPLLSTTVFLVIINGASTVWYIAMIGLFLCGSLLCIRYREQLAGRWLAPPFVIQVAAIFGVLASCIAIFTTFFVGSPVPGVLNNQDWVFWVLLVVLASLTIGAIYSFLVPEAEDLLALLQRKREQAPAAKNPPSIPVVGDSAFPPGQEPFSQPFPESWQPNATLPTHLR